MESKIIVFHYPNRSKNTVPRTPSNDALDRILQGAGRSRVFSAICDHVDSVLTKHGVIGTHGDRRTDDAVRDFTEAQSEIIGQWRKAAARPVARSAKAGASQAGMALLIEMLIVCVVMMVLAAAAIPNLVQVGFDRQQSDAKDRVRIVGRAEAAAAICASTPGCSISAGVSALIPAANNSIQTGGYTFRMSADGATFTATPINPTSGQQTFSVTSNDLLMCGGAVCR